MTLHTSMPGVWVAIAGIGGGSTCGSGRGGAQDALLYPVSLYGGGYGCCIGVIGGADGCAPPTSPVGAVFITSLLRGFTVLIRPRA